MAKTQPANSMTDPVSHPIKSKTLLKEAGSVLPSSDSSAQPSATARTGLGSAIAASEITASHDRLPPGPSRAVFPFGYTRQDLQRYGAFAITAIIAVYFLIQVQSILPPFLIALFLAALLDPSIRYLERRGRSRVYAIFLFYLMGLLFVILVFTIVVPKLMIQVEDISQNFPKYSTTITDTANSFLLDHTKLLKKIGIKQTNIDEIFKQTGPIKNYTSAFLTTVTVFFTGLASKAVWLIIIPVSGFFLMRDYPTIRARAIALCPENSHDQLDRMSTEIVDLFGAYLRGLAKICAIYGLWTFALLLLLNVQYALFLGLMAGLFYAIPYLGQLMSASVIGIMAYSMLPHKALFFFAIKQNSLFYAILTACAVILSNNIFDQVVYPRVVGQSVGLHPVVSFFALACGATLFGIWGMLLAVPVAASIQVVLMSLFPKIKQPPLAHLLNSQTGSSKTS